MREVLKGNFTPKNPVRAGEPSDDLTETFEREALKKLGGSISSFPGRSSSTRGMRARGTAGRPVPDHRRAVGSHRPHGLSFRR